MAQFKYGLFYDFHTLADVPDVGERFDAEKFTDEIRKCGVDFLTFHARCNQGNAYYNTKIGKKHPSLKRDLFGEIAACCRKKGIRLSAYMNGSLSNEELMDHPEWLHVFEDGRNMRFGHDVWTRLACFNTSYRQHIIDMYVEVAKNYPVDGFFIDCLTAEPCYCDVCTKMMLARGLNPTSKEDHQKFQEDTLIEFCNELHAAVEKVLPNTLFYYNGAHYHKVMNISSHLEAECLPTSFWGYECLPDLAHSMRRIAGKGKSVLNMTGRFFDWGDFGGLRQEPSLKYDMLYGMAHGMRPDIGGHFHPRGDMDQPVFDRIRSVYHYLQQFDPWVLDAENEPKVAIVAEGYTAKFYLRKPGASIRMLDELKIQFDLVSRHENWDNYDLLIFPDDVKFQGEILEKVKKHAAKGGKIIATGCSGLNAEGTAFALPEVWPAEYVSPSPYNVLFYDPEGPICKDFPKMPLGLYAPGFSVKPVSGSETLLCYVKPYFNADIWDGLRAHRYVPPQEKTDLPFLMRKGNVVYCSGQIFSGYFDRAPHYLRMLVEQMFNLAGWRRKIVSDTLPVFSRAIVQSKGNTDLVHILSYCPEKRNEAIAVDEPITIMDTVLKADAEGRTVKEVYLAPDRKKLDWSMEDGRVVIPVERIDGYALIVIEYQA